MFISFKKEGIKIPTRKQKQKIYEQKYSQIPIDYNERLNWMIDQYHISPSKMQEILDKRSTMMNNLQWFDYQIVQLLEEPEGASRPKTRIINRANFAQAAKTNPMVHVYVPNAGDDHAYMRRLVNDELDGLDSLIATPCCVDYDIYIKTPTVSTVDLFLCEIGLIRPSIRKPDWDNAGKKYCDMYNSNVWLDDALVIDGSVHKYYSILPRVEIRLRYLNCVYNKKFYSAITSRVNFDEKTELHYLNNKGELI